MAIENRGGADCDAVEMKEEAMPFESFRQFEVAPINPSVLPRCRIPFLPGKPADAVRQGYTLEGCICKLRLVRAFRKLAAEQPVLIQQQRLGSGASLNFGARKPCAAATPTSSGSHDGSAKGEIFEKSSAAEMGVFFRHM